MDRVGSEMWIELGLKCEDRVGSEMWTELDLKCGQSWI